MLRVSTVMTGVPGAPYYSNMFFDGTDAPAASAASDAVHVFWTSFGAAMMNTIDIQVESDVDLVDAATGQVTGQFNVPQTPIAATGVGTPLPWANQGLVRWTTGVFVNGRQLRGRTFIPAMQEENSQLGVPLPASLALWQPWITALATTGGFGIYSQTHRQFALVEAGSPWDNWATLRSRRD